MKQSKTVLHHYLGTGLKMISESGTKLTLHGLHDLSDDTINYILENEVLNSRYVELKPALHSMNRLTMPLENGEIPLLVLAAICGTCSSNDFVIDGFYARHKTQKESTFEYSETASCFLWRESEKWKDFGAVPRQLHMFQYLIKNHFNVFNLPESEYIEKSTLTR